MSGQADGKQIKDATVTRGKLVNWLPEGHINGCELSKVSATQVSVATGIVRDGNDELDISVPSLLTATITASGANGLDTGAEAASTPYAVYVIFDEDGVETTASLISASFTSPTLPSGYTHSRLVGSFSNGPTSNIFGFSQTGHGRERTYMFDSTASDFLVLNGGSATVFTDVDVSDWIPPTSQLAIIQLGLDTTALGAVDDEIRIRINGGSGASPLRCGPGVITSSYYYVIANVPLDSSQVFEYRVSVADNLARLRLVGYVENL